MAAGASQLKTALPWRPGCYKPAGAVLAAPCVFVRSRPCSPLSYASFDERGCPSTSGCGPRSCAAGILGPPAPVFRLFVPFTTLTTYSSTRFNVSSTVPEEVQALWPICALGR